MIFCEVCLSYLNALDKNYFIIVLDENFFRWVETFRVWYIHYFESWADTSSVSIMILIIPNTEDFYHYQEVRISYDVIVECYSFKKMESKNNFCISQNIIDIPILLVIIWVNVGPLDVNYWHSRMVYDGLILSSITKSYIFVKAHSFEYYQVHFKHFYFKLSIFNFLIRKQLNHSMSVYKVGIR